MSIYDQVRWRGIKPTVKVAQEAGKKVTVGAASTPILAANDDRTSFLLQNIDSVACMVSFAAAADGNGPELHKYDVLMCDDYTGAVSGITAAGNAQIRIIEV